MKRPYRATKTKNAAIDFCKSVLLSCILTAALVLLLAISMKWEWIAIERVEIVNTLIKAVSACLAGLTSSRIRVRRCWLLAGCAGVLYMVVAFAVFGILAGGFTLGFGHVSDVLMAFACASCTCIGVTILFERRTQKG